VIAGKLHADVRMTMYAKGVRSTAADRDSADWLPTIRHIAPGRPLLRILRLPVHRRTTTRRLSDRRDVAPDAIDNGGSASSIRSATSDRTVFDRDPC